jgi:hypothetical protein
MITARKRGYLFVLFIFLSTLCLGVFVLNLQSADTAPVVSDFYYYSSGRKIMLPLSKEKLSIRFKPGVTLEQQKSIVESEPVN